MNNDLQNAGAFDPQDPGHPGPDNHDNGNTRPTPSRPDQLVDILDKMNNAQLVTSKDEGPQPLMRKIDPATAYPVKALGPLRGAVEAVAERTGAPIAMIAQSALAVASLATQAHGDVEGLGGASPISLYCLTVAESGERKSTCDNLLTSGVRDHERQEVMAHKAALEEWDLVNRQWTAKRDHLIKETTKTGPKGLEAETDLTNLGPAPLKPLTPHLILTDPTYEGLLKLFIEGQPSLGILNDEAGSFIGGHAMNSENRTKTISGLSQLWSEGTANRTRAGDGVVTLYGRRLTTHLMGQPVVMAPFLADPVSAGQGYLPRYLITHPASTIGTRIGNTATPEGTAALTAFSSKVAGMLRQEKPLCEDDRQTLEPIVLQLSPGAKAVLTDYYNFTEEAQQAGERFEMVRAFAARSPELAARIAGVLTLFEDLSAGEVAGETMKSAVDLAQFYLEEARRLIENAVVSQEVALAEKLRVWIQSKWPEIAKRGGRDPGTIIPGDVSQYGPSALKVVKAAIRTMDDLAEAGAGWLTRLPAGEVVDGRRRKISYRIERG